MDILKNNIVLKELERLKNTLFRNFIIFKIIFLIKLSKLEE